MKSRQFRHYLELMEIAGSIISIESMGTQTEIAHKIIFKKAYVLALKANYPTSYNQVKQWFETALVQNFQGGEVTSSY
ncbi:hypothetical protein NWP21_14890 [Anabaenopsis sp. FSS-46]|uniref:hypothetical protein n=1 Tax=Anabaenopsis sp. FSS-46 TaxID=2971766 RepID=UPI0024732126|nr:hypothetical protein [Anabaenopsis sp. FSS-46]MDH6100101.1 hypothetical protein [Anabaenopsis sp. FSS-46]